MRAITASAYLERSKLGSLSASIAPTPTPHDYGGMGVGLYIAIAREVIAQHGGTMWFGSEENSGSKFCFTLVV